MVAYSFQSGKGPHLALLGRHWPDYVRTLEMAHDSTADVQLHMPLQERVDNQKTPQNTVNLLCSTIKPNAEDESIRFCFRVVSPEKVYSLQVCCT